jgi:hypothetical protein
MSITKTLLGIALALAVAVSQASLAAAAPTRVEITGTIDTITADDSTDTVTVEWTGGSPIELSYAEADNLDLISLDENGDATVLYDPAAGLIEITVEDESGELVIIGVDLTDAVPLEEVDQCAPGGGEDNGEILAEDSEVLEGEDGGGGHPVGSALCDFFGESMGLTYDQIMGWHEDGFGFGVIAQALWMAEMEGLDPEEILAVKSGEMDYGDLGLPEGVDNWGRLRSYVFGKGAEKTVHNLGEIMSKRADPLVTETPTGEPTEEATLTSSTTTTLQTMGNGKGGEHGKSEGKGKGKNK